MAIVKMKKITLIGLEEQKELILDKLMKLGVVEIESFEPETAQEELRKLVTRDGDEALVSRIESDLAKVKSSIDHLDRFGNKKKGLFTPKRVVDIAQLDGVEKNRDKIWKVVEQIGEYDELLSALRTEENRLLNLVASLEPWQGLDIPLETSSTKYTSILLGTVPSTSDVEKLMKDMGEQVPESHIEEVNRDKDQVYLFVIYHRAFEEATLDVLKQYGFNRIQFKDLKDTPKSNILQSKKRLEDIQREREEIWKKIAALSDEKENLEMLYDHLMVKRDRKKALSNLAKTDKAFMLKGWLPAEVAEKVSSDLKQEYDCFVETEEPGKDEEVPILLKNNSFVQSFEIITELYSLPNSREVDPTPFMAPFYFLFFGMMISDAGYGLLLAIATGIILLKFKLKGMTYKLVKMLFFGGISTVIWGALFGGWFGDVAKVISSGKFEIKPIWFNPLDDPMRLLIWSFIFGGVHIFVGMGIKAYMLIKDGQIKDAVYDIFSWYVFLIGLVLLGVGSTSGGGSGRIAAEIGKYMAIAGALVLVLTQGRNEKNAIKRFLSGILSLYSVTGYLSDVLSYSRLLALGLATGVVASVINTMGSLFGFNVAGIIIFAIVFVVGTVFNIAINALGAYVHSSRLQYVEFFSKFYEGGGKAFQPFRINTKYTNIK